MKQLQLEVTLTEHELLMISVNEFESFPNGGESTSYIGAFIVQNDTNVVMIDVNNNILSFAGGIRSGIEEILRDIPTDYNTWTYNLNEYMEYEDIGEVLSDLQAMLPDGSIPKHADLVSLLEKFVRIIHCKTCKLTSLAHRSYKLCKCSKRNRIYYEGLRAKAIENFGDDCSWM